QCCQSSRY
ncbi:chlamydia polymorphic membrane middle domain protein, partial [Chlamydia psittaci 08DC60]